MNKKYEAILKSSRELLENMDTDILLDKFLKLQEKATGPTVNEFLTSISNSDRFFKGHDSHTSYDSCGMIPSGVSANKINTLLDTSNLKKGYFLDVGYISRPPEPKSKMVKASYGLPIDDSLSQAA